MFDRPGLALLNLGEGSEFVIPINELPEEEEEKAEEEKPVSWVLTPPNQDVSHSLLV